MTADCTITFRSSDFARLPLAAQQLISLFCGPLPDKNGVVTMVSEMRWGEIQAAIETGRV
jgi:hypothetical protein